MPRMTQAEVDAFNARRRTGSGRITMEDFNSWKEYSTEDESRLHRQIMDECARRGWQFFHGSMAHRSMMTRGMPDFVIQADGGSTFYVECKSRTGKLSPEQAGVIAWAARLGHVVHVVRSLGEFLEIVTNPPSDSSCAQMPTMPGSQA